MNLPETEIGGEERRFPSTSFTALGELRKADPQARRKMLEDLIGHYWKPVYCVIRASWSKSNEDAKDLTQEFFVRAVLEGSLVDGFDPERGSFRTFLKGALSHFMMNQARDAGTLRRGGTTRFVSLDAQDIDLAEFIPDGLALPPDRLFDAAWKNAILGRALRRLEERLALQGRGECFRIFCRYELEGGPEAPSYRTIAEECGLTADVVKHALFRAREEYRVAVSEVLLGTVASAELLDRELRELFGA
jgi:RNA polymerase sigma factor (sigma-70 family)